MSSAAAPENNLLENVRFLHAYLECSDAIQEGVKAMLRIAFDPDTTEDEKRMALHTVADALFPKPHKGVLGMDLEESEFEASQENPEMLELVQEMNHEEEIFSSRLRELMEERDITQMELASRIGVGQPAISNMLNRQCRPQRRTIIKLAEALEVAPTDLWPGFESSEQVRP